jgi:periplasmic protein TonB
VNYLLKSFQISFALHALVFLLLIFMGDRFISSEKILVIDFTLEDNAGHRAAVNTQARERNAQQREIKKKDAETAEPPVQTVPPAMPPVTINSQESPGVEIQMPVLPRHEATARSAIGEQDSTGKGIRPEGSAPVAENINVSPGRGADNFVDAERIKYMKENFFYIKDLINRQVTYPKTARQMGWQGKVKISFFISSNGYAKGIKIVESSGVAVLDKNAIEAVKSSSPFPKPPVEAQLIIPISYQLH